MFQKTELRKHYLQKRNILTDDDVAHLSEKISKKIITQFLNEKKSQKIHLFLPIQKLKEVDLWFLIRYIWSETYHQLFIPKMQGVDLQHFELTPQTILQQNHWGILEPLGGNIYTDYQYDIIITPLLYADAKGNRIGYGKGFYDRFFTQIPQKTLKVGVNFFPPNQEIADVSPFDVPLDFLVTPDKIYEF